MHPLLARRQRHPAVQALTRAATNARGVSSNAAGLSTLGSLAHYRGDMKITEDVTELMTMYAWEPTYLRDFTEFLSVPTKAATRQSLGLVSLSEGATLFKIVETATAATLA